MTSKTWRSRPHIRRHCGIECWRSRRGCSTCSRRGNGDRSIRTRYVAWTGRASKRGIAFSRQARWRRSPRRLLKPRRLTRRLLRRFGSPPSLDCGSARSSQSQWAHVDFDTGRLLLPETKTGRRFHDLPSAALAILTELPRINAWAFTTGRDAPVTYRTVRRHFANIAAKAGLDDVRLHDLRRTVMTTAAAAGVGTHVLRDLLGHKTTAMADRYIRTVGNPVRDAREQVGSAMAAMMNGEGGEVVPLRRDG